MDNQQPNNASTSPTTTVRPISASEITPLFRRDPATWTDEESALVAAYNEQLRQQAAERAEKEARLKEEGRKNEERYWQMIIDTDQQQPLSLDAFLANLNAKQHTPRKPDLTPYASSLPQYLAAAYQQMVSSRGRDYRNDTYTHATVGQVAQWLLSPRPGILLRGNVGVGKTTMLYALQTTLLLLANYALTIKTASDITTAAKDCPTDYQAYCKATMLGIDDLGTEPSSVKQYGNELSPIVELIEKRYTSNLPTLITTNLVTVGGKDEIADRYGIRTLDRLREMCSILTYDGNQKSYRK